MKDFGEWIDENKHALDENVYGLFYDSFRCFKNDIDRPAYLLAYQGMMQHVRMVVLNSPCKPDGFTDNEWNHLWLSSLRNDDEWEETAFKCTQQKEKIEMGTVVKTAVMNIQKEVREKFPFWRQFRNVCAHYKGFDLHKAHTLTLYSFIEQYFFTLSVEGSCKSLNSLFDDYFNPSLTSRHEDIHPLLAKIDMIIRDDEFDNFFSEVRKSCANHERYNNRFHDFVHEVITSCPHRVKDAIVKYIQSDDEFFDRYLEHYPKDVLCVLTGATAFIHNFWHDRLPNLRKKLTILALMLSSECIPIADQVEAMRKCLQESEENITGTDYSNIPDCCVKTLVEKGYFNMFYDMFFNPDHTSRYFQKICYQTNFYIGMISLIPWDKRYAEQLIAVCSEEHVPYTLQDRLKDMYNNQEEYKAAIDKICLNEGLTLPGNIV